MKPVIWMFSINPKSNRSSLTVKEQWTIVPGRTLPLQELSLGACEWERTVRSGEGRGGGCFFLGVTRASPDGTRPRHKTHSIARTSIQNSRATTAKTRHLSQFVHEECSGVSGKLIDPDCPPGKARAPATNLFAVNWT
jgi:hypothetical protein